MDNLTHTLIGAVAGETLARTTRPGGAGLPASTRRDLLVMVSALGSNLPDLDIVWTWRGFSDSSIAYLLEHRGYTHTLVGCAALALLLYLGALLWVRWRTWPFARSDHVTLAAMAAIAVFGHLGMDALNSYGVHPFWPWNNRWYYGDSLFIVEPLYWIAALPLLFVLRSRLARYGLALAACVALIAVFGLQRAQPVQEIGIAAIAAALTFVGRRCTPRLAALCAATAMLCLTGTFVAASHAAGKRMTALAASGFPAASTLDTVLTPGPTNPGCWDVLLLQTEGPTYTTRHGVLATGSARNPARCSRIQQGQGGTAIATPVAGTSSADLTWIGETRLPRARFAELAKTDCAARELLQFARAPFAVERNGQWILGDLRFDRGVGAGFATLLLPRGLDTPCRFSAPWTPPRTDLLSLAD